MQHILWLKKELINKHFGVFLLLFFALFTAIIYTSSLWQQGYIQITGIFLLTILIWLWNTFWLPIGIVVILYGLKEFFKN